MAKLRKQIQSLGLLNYDVLIEDSATRSEYFKVTQFDGYFYGGRNAFLLAGSPVLQVRTKVFVEVLNSQGQSIYSSPVADYIEGSSRLIQVEVYKDTPIGPGKLIIVGCAEKFADGRDIPLKWKNTYNTRWVSDVIISPLVENRTPIRFTKTPSVFVQEKFYFKPLESAFSESIEVPLNISLEPKYFNIYPNGYIARITTPGSVAIYKSEYVGGTLSGSFSYNGSTARANIPITKIYTTKLALSEGQLITTDNNEVVLNATAPLKVKYDKLVTQSTSSFISFADLRVTDLNTISGKVDKIRFSYKRSTDPGQFELLGEVETSVSELLITDLDNKRINIGNFQDVVVNDYWYIATMSVQQTDFTPSPPNIYNSSIFPPTQSFTSSSALIDGITFNPQLYTNASSCFIGTRNNNAVELFNGTEYTLSFNAVVTPENISQDISPTMQIYLTPSSGSNTNLLVTSRLGQLIGSVTPESNFIAQNFDTLEFNFTPKVITAGKFNIRFVMYGGVWSIANVSLKPAEESMFNPDEISVLLPNTSYSSSLLTFKAEYLDVDNNSLKEFSVSTPTFFSGSEDTDKVTPENLYYDND